MANPLSLLNLKARILLVVVGLIVAGILGFAIHMASALRADLETLISAQLISQVDFIARETDGELQFRIEILNEIAASIPSELLADPAQLQRVLVQRQAPATLFPLGIVAIDRQGRVVADYGTKLDYARSGYVGDRDYFQQVIALGKPIVGGPIQSRFAARMIVPIAVPMRDRAGNIVGVLVNPADLFDRDLFGKINESKIGNTGKFLVVSPRDHLIVAATDHKRIMTPLPKRGINPLLDRRLYDGFEGAGVTVSSQGIEVISANRNMTSIGWMVIATLDTVEAFAPIKSLIRNIYLTAILLSLSVAVALVFFLVHQMRPLDEAGIAMQGMTDGTAPLATLPVKRNDEIGKLVCNFNRLIESRKQADDMIHGLNQDLERRVLERTRQLLIAVEAQQAEISERKQAEKTALNYAEQLQVMTRRLVDVQETDRHQLAQELHDRGSSNLTAIHLNFKLIAGLSARQAAAELESRAADITALIEDTIASAREIVSDLHPAILSYGGLHAALKEHAARFERRTGIAARVTIAAPVPELPDAQEVALFRIAQEALMNCAKHGDAKAVEICLTGDAGAIVLTISDDGVGFDPRNVGRRGQAAGLGLLSMQERAEAVGGTCSVESTPGSGTKVVIKISWAGADRAA